jgi:hypothetical protein
MLKNYLVNYELVLSTPNIFTQNNNNMIYNINYIDYKTIQYKYYTDTRHGNYNYNSISHTIKELEFNNIINIKPTIYFYSDYIITNNIIDFSYINKEIFDNIIYFIVSYDSTYKIIYKSELTNNNLQYKLSITDSNILIFYSNSYPYFVYNNIVLNYRKDSVYCITSYDKLLLEQNEIIIIDGNYFIVLGLVVSSNIYELELIEYNNEFKYNYKGYYTIGNYLKKNSIIPEISYQNVMKYYKSKQLFVGDTYYDFSNNILKYVTTPIVQTDCFQFSEKSTIISLYHKNGRFFLFDNMIKLKILDKIIYNNTLYEIYCIRDNEIFYQSNN